MRSKGTVPQLTTNRSDESKALKGGSDDMLKGSGRKSVERIRKNLGCPLEVGCRFRVRCWCAGDGGWRMAGRVGVRLQIVGAECAFLTLRKMRQQSSDFKHHHMLPSYPL
jgi:hypothetical protein